MNEPAKTKVNPEGVSIQELLERALGPNGFREKSLDNMIQDLHARGTGAPIVLPSGQMAPPTIGPSNSQIQLETLLALRIALQSLRFIMLALDSMAAGSIHPIHDESIHDSMNGGKGAG